MSDITVVIPTIPPRQQLLRQALTSVVRQTTPAASIIVEYDHNRDGVATVRNRALVRVQTKWVAWLDDDDQLLPNHLETLLATAEQNPDASLIYPVPRLIGGSDPTAVSVGGQWQLPWGVPFETEQKLHLLHHGSFIPITHLVRTEAALRIGGFPPSRTLAGGRLQGEDERYLIALLENDEKFVHVNEETWIWNVHDGNTAGLPGRW